MGFIREYGAQGDPFSRRTLRAGRLQRRPVFGTDVERHALLAQMAGSRRFGARFRGPLGIGDPFKFRMPKFVRKLSLKKVVRGAGKLLKTVAPIALPFVGGPLGAVAGAFLGGREGSGGGPDAPAPELAYDAPSTGTVGEASRERFEGYEVPGVEVRARRLPENVRRLTLAQLLDTYGAELFRGQSAGDFDEEDYGDETEDQVDQVEDEDEDQLLYEGDY